MKKLSYIAQMARGSSRLVRRLRYIAASSALVASAAAGRYLLPPPRPMDDGCRLGLLTAEQMRGTVGGDGLGYLCSGVQNCNITCAPTTHCQYIDQGGPEYQQCRAEVGICHQSNVRTCIWSKWVDSQCSFLPECDVGYSYMPTCSASG